MKRFHSASQVAFVLFLVVASIGAGVGTAGATATSSADTCRTPTQDTLFSRGVNVPASEAAVNATVARINDTAVRFTYHDLDADEDGFGPGLPTWLYELGIRVKSAEGFQVDRTEFGAALVWNASVATPSVTFTTSTQPRSGSFDEAGAAIQPEWAFLPLPQHSRPTNVSLASGQPGVVGDQVLLLGEYTMYHRSVGCHDIELYIPDALDTVESPTAIADSLEATARNLNVGWRYDTVRVFGVGAPVRLGGRAFTHEVWVHVNSTFKPKPSRGIRYPPQLVPANVWVHEYVHTRERWAWNSSVSSDAQWLTEAMASYYMIAETERQGRMLAYNETLYWMQLNESLRFGDNRMNLTNRSTYQREQGAYTRGAFVLAALDAEIRSQTGGKKSLEDVFRRLNQQEEVTHSSFRRAVVAVGGEEMGPWVSRYVVGTAVPPAPGIPLEVYLELLPRRRDYQTAAGMVLIIVLAAIGAIVQRYRTQSS